MTDKKLRLTVEREAHPLYSSKQKLSFASHVPAPIIGQIESQRFVPYPPQLERLARALGFLGDAEELLEPVDEAEAVES